MSDTNKTTELASDARLSEHQRAAAQEFYKTLEMTAAALHRLSGAGAVTLTMTVSMVNEDKTVRPLTLGVTMCNSKEVGTAHTQAMGKITEDSLAQISKSEEDPEVTQ